MSDKKTATGVFRNLPDSYEDLCQQIAFPRPIKDAVDYENMLEVVERLVVRPELTEGQAEYLDAVTTFIEKYEASESPFDPAPATDVLRHLMASNEMSPSELSKLLGDDSRSLAGRLLSGERQLSKAHIARLCEHFGISADVFIPARAPGGPIPDGDGVVPPRGWVLVQVQDEDARYWMDPQQLRSSSREPDPARLTMLQKRRIRAFKDRLGPLDPVSLTQTLKNFSRDEHPDREIAIWEAVADVCEEELARRPTADDRERHLVFKAAVTCTLSRVSVDDVVSMRPELKGLPDLARVVSTYAERLAKRLAEST